MTDSIDRGIPSEKEFRPTDEVKEQGLKGKRSPSSSGIMRAKHKEHTVGKEAKGHRIPREIMPHAIVEEESTSELTQARRGSPSMQEVKAKAAVTPAPLPSTGKPPRGAMGHQDILRGWAVEEGTPQAPKQEVPAQAIGDVGIGRGVPMQAAETLCRFDELGRRITVLPPPDRSTSEGRWDALKVKTGGLKFGYLSPGALAQRFGNISCPSATAIKVEGKTLHANRVGGKDVGSVRQFVASQAPHPQALESFWKFVGTNPDGGIIDLTTPADRTTDRGDFTKVYEYYPTEENPTVTYGSMVITLKQSPITEENGAKRYEYTVEDTETKTSRTVTRYHYDQWKDFKGVQVKTLDTLIATLDTPAFSGSNTVIHCRAGVGRTGTLTTAALLRDKINSGEVTEENLSESVETLVCGLRRQRGEWFVQQPEQYELVLEYGRQLLTQKKK